MKKIICVAVVTMLLGGCSQTNTIQSIPKTISIKKDFILIEGRWEKTTKGYSHIIPKINSTSIICDKNSMTCVEREAMVITPQERSLLKESLLDVQEFEYQIIEWSDSLVRAKREAPVADVEIRISLKDESVEKSFRETKARGSETANPNVFGHWILK